MKFGELKSHLNEALAGNGFAPAYLVHGNEDYLVGEAAKMFSKVVDGEFANFNYTVTHDAEEAVDTLYTFPVFDVIRVCVLDLSEGADEAAKQRVKAYLSSPAQESVLVLIADDPVIREVKTPSCEDVTCSALSREETEEYVRSLFKEEPAVDVAPDAVDELIVRTGSSLARIVSEVKKLKAYSPSGIKKRDVEDMVAPDMDYQVYLLAEAVSKRDGKAALTQLDVMLNDGVTPRTIMNALYDRFRRLLHVSLNKNRSNEELARLFGFKKPGAIYFLRQNAENYSQVRLKNIVDYLHGLLYASVTGARSEQSAMYEAMLDILNM